MQEGIFALIGTAVGALIGFLGTCFVLRFNYRQLFAQTVSSNRMDWINVWRENISRFLACQEVIIHKNTDCKHLIDLRKDMLIAKNMVISRLNLEEEKHKCILTIINSFSDQMTNDEFLRQKDLLLANERIILKLEWERVKDEARGRKNNV